MTVDLTLHQRHLSPQQLTLMRAVAAVLLPGSAESPAPAALPDFDTLLQQAAAALEGEGRALAEAMTLVPAQPTWENLSTFAQSDPGSFEQVSLLAVGAYFMSPAVLTALGRPAGKRRRANPEQVVDELGTGLLDPVFERGCPVKSLQEVNAATESWNG